MQTSLTLTPNALRQIAYQELRDLIDDLCNHIPPSAAQTTDADIERLYTDTHCIAMQLQRLTDAIDRAGLAEARS